MGGEQSHLGWPPAPVPLWGEPGLGRTHPRPGMAADRRPSKVTSKALSAVFQRLDQRCRPAPAGSSAHQRQVDAFERGLLRREMSTGIDRPPDPRVDAVDRVGRADDSGDLAVELQEGHELSPGIGPQPDDRRISLLNSTNRSRASDSDAAVQRPALPGSQALQDLLRDGGDGLLGDLHAVDPGQAGADSPARERTSGRPHLTSINRLPRCSDRAKGFTVTS